MNGVHDLASASGKPGSSVPFAIVANYDDIKSFLASLGAPKQGTRRVFRGQTRGYVDEKSGMPSLLPALARDPGNREVDPAWLVSVELYAATRGETPLSELSYRFVDLWGPALLQHYGPGSSYLDVTADMDVALWFSLAKRYERWVSTPTPTGIMRRMRLAWHSDLAAGQCGESEFYVFDAIPWSGVRAPAHGELVDLLERKGASEVPEEAVRLRHQNGSLLYCDPGHPQGANLGLRLKGYVRFAAYFLRESVPSFGRAITDLYPSPVVDPFYKALLAVPAAVRFNPTRLEHPLAIPCYLSREPHFIEPLEPPGSQRIDSAGEPLEIKIDDQPMREQLSPFVDLGASMNPPLLYQYLLTDNPSLAEPAIPVSADGRQYRFAAATPFLLDVPYTRFLPFVDLDLAESEWLQSALPIGIQASVLGRPTDNVYVEFSPADVFFPRKRERAQDDDLGSIRGVWLARSENRYWTTIFLQSPQGILSLFSEFRFVPMLGRFFRVRPQNNKQNEDNNNDDVDSYYDLSAKGLFSVLTLLRDLSPGLKPPSVFALGLAKEDGGPISWLAGSLLEPQLARAEPVAGTPYLVPKAINGKTYARGYGMRAVEDWRVSEDGLQALTNAVRAVREPNYLIEAAAELAEMYGQRQRFKEALDVAEFALATVQTAPKSDYLRGFEAILEVLKGRALFCLHQKEKALNAFHRAIRIRREQGQGREASSIEEIVQRLFSPPA